MIARRAVPLWRLLALRLRLDIWRYLVKRALCRGLIRFCEWMMRPAG